MKIFLIIACLLPHLSIAKMDTPISQVNQNIKSFFKSPNDFYFSVIPKSNTTKITNNENRSNDALRNRIMYKPQKSGPFSNDDVSDLFPRMRIEKRLSKLLKSAEVATQPWSDDYWPIYKGILGARYSDKDFHETYSWEEARNYVLENPMNPEMTSEFIDQLSPAEKYDLLISNENHLPLKKSMWAQGESYFNNYGEVERWMGICHGWAPASFMVERPKKSISVMSANGKYKIKFYPADLKALASLLWASTDYDSNFVGGRCRSKTPEADVNDRLIARDCLDNNPATFHLALANGIGIKNQSFVMDATYDYEVWNQPVISYQVKFFNVTNKESVEALEDAIVELNDFTEDPYKKYRARGTKYIVGVYLEVKYGVETVPRQNEVDNESMDQKNTAHYYYDLELNQNKEVIGGEWYNFQHPDFLWRPVDGADALTYNDFYLMSDDSWSGEKSLSKRIKDLGVGSASEGKPLAYIVKSLIKLSNKSENIK